MSNTFGRNDPAQAFPQTSADLAACFEAIGRLSDQDLLRLLNAIEVERIGRERLKSIGADASATIFSPESLAQARKDIELIESRKQFAALSNKALAQLRGQ